MQAASSLLYCLGSLDIILVHFPTSLLQPVLASLQLLLQANDHTADPQKKGVALVGGVNSAMTVLPTTPTLHGVAMETLTTAYQLLFSQHERVLII